MSDEHPVQLSLFDDVIDSKGDDFSAENKGVVYFVRSPSTKLIKIGFAESFERRQSQYATHTPEKLQWLFVVKTNNFKRLEKQLHQQFYNKRKHREWFALNTKDLVWVWRNISHCHCVNKRFKRWLVAMRYNAITPGFIKRFNKERKRLKNPFNDTRYGICIVQ